MRKIKVGLYGLRGHQIQARFKDGDLPWAQLVAVAGFEGKRVRESVRVYDTLDELLADPAVELVSLCSPLRSEQAAHAVKAMRAGKHVYAEKPVATTEADLDLIVDAARQTGMQFHEMGGSQLSQPYRAVHDAIAAGAIGTVVQVFAQKCYPWTERRPADERIDGGLALQVGVYLARFVEHVAGVRIAGAAMAETRAGNPVPGHDCRMAVGVHCTLANGGLASGIANYLNPMGDRCWGYEILRVFGTAGIVESTLETGAARLLRPGRAPEMLDVSAPGEDYFDLYVRSLLGQAAMPLTIEDELSPTRWMVRAKQAAVLNG
jgi:predicted dehydrogenase